MKRYRWPRMNAEVPKDTWECGACFTNVSNTIRPDEHSLFACVPRQGP